MIFFILIEQIWKNYHTFRKLPDCYPENRKSSNTLNNYEHFLICFYPDNSLFLNFTSYYYLYSNFVTGYKKHIPMNTQQVISAQNITPVSVHWSGTVYIAYMLSVWQHDIKKTVHQSKAFTFGEYTSSVWKAANILFLRVFIIVPGKICRSLVPLPHL